MAENIIIKKFKVCIECFSVGTTDITCICLQTGDYPKVELEFEVCSCCGNLVSDGNPIESEFNDEQLKKLAEETEEAEYEGCDKDFDEQLELQKLEHRYGTRG